MIHVPALVTCARCVGAETPPAHVTSAGTCIMTHVCPSLCVTMMTTTPGGVAHAAYVMDVELDLHHWSMVGSSAPAVVSLGPKEASVLFVEAAIRRMTMIRL